MTDISNERRALRQKRFQESSGDPPPAPSDAPPSPAGFASQVGEGWKPIDAYALSGVPVLVSSAGGRIEAAHHIKTRQVKRVDGLLMWAPTTLWRVWNASGTTLPFDPIAYRELYRDH